jgi:electron transport complex protein RnfD
MASARPRRWIPLKPRVTPGSRLSKLDGAIYHGALAGIGWQWVNIAYLVGGLFLLWQRLFAGIFRSVSWSACGLLYLGWLLHPENVASPQMHLLSGATMLGASLF